VPTEDLAAFVGAALDDLHVRAVLLPLRGSAFAEQVVALAGERGLVVSTDEVDEALRDARRTWWERWV
jgi:hypothetical protein